jgi:UDP-glucose 4-epimerase
MKIICTGAAGFIGSHLADRLISNGHDVAIIDDLSNGLEANINKKITHWWGCGIESHHAAQRIKEFKPDVVFHLAALGSVPFSVKHPDWVFTANVAGTANMLKAAVDAGVGRFVFASSASYYGDDPMISEFGPIKKTEGMPPRPLNHYGASKVMGELWGKAFHRMHGLPFVAMRFFNVFGPRQRDDTPLAAVVPKFIKAALTDGGRIEMHNSGVQTRDLTYVDNVVDALISVTGDDVGPQVSGESFNVCTGNQVSIRDLAIKICRLAGRSASEMMNILQMVDARSGDIRDSMGSYDKLLRATGWTPKVTWQEGIERMIQAKQLSGRIG